MSDVTKVSVDFRNALDPRERVLYDYGYHDASVNMNEVLKDIILRAETAERALVEVTGLILGNEIIFAGGSAEEAREAFGALGALMEV